MTMWIMLVLAVALFLLPVTIATGAGLVMLPIAAWGAVGWALQVPQNNELIKVRERQGDGNLAVALNESALYLGSAIGAALGGLLLLQQWQAGAIAYGASAVAVLGMVAQWWILRRIRGERRGPGGAN